MTGSCSLALQNWQHALALMQRGRLPVIACSAAWHLRTTVNTGSPEYDSC